MTTAAPAHTLLCTVGTSLLDNLARLPDHQGYEQWLGKQPEADRHFLSASSIEGICAAYVARDDETLAQELARLDHGTRLLGAELTSIADMAALGYCREDPRVVLFRSSTETGERAAELVGAVVRAWGMRCDSHDIVAVEGLQDDEPNLFRTTGLRNLARQMGGTLRDFGGEHAAVNATGGYKAQIAVAVMLGQALGVTVYYKHERFSEIISFPPMPIAPDHDLWLRHSGTFFALERDILPAAHVDDDWDERLEVLIERIEIDGERWIELSPTGQIFHDLFKTRITRDRRHSLPVDVPSTDKKAPRLSNHSWGNARQTVLATLERVIDQVPYVVACRADYFNANLALQSLFRFTSRDGGRAIEGVLSNGTSTAKFIVETSARTDTELEAALADLNERAGDLLR